MEQAVSNYLSNLGIPISKKHCEKLIASHADYPSLLSIADTLERLGIDHTIARVKKKDWEEIPFPCLFHYDGNTKDLELKLAQNYNDLPADTSKDASLVILKAHPIDEIKDEENNKERSKERLLKNLTTVSFFAITGLLLLISLPFETWTQGALLLTTIVGTVLGYLLVAKDVGITYDPVETFCKSGKKTNCDTVLNSDAATLFGDITVSDLVIGYFMFQLVVVGFCIPAYGVASTFSWVLFMLSLLTIPVVLYSGYFQSFKIKAWCRLCLLVDGILVLQAGLFGYMYFSGELPLFVENVNIISLAQTGLIFLGISSSVLLIKYSLKEANRAEENEVKANRIKYDPEVFLHLLSKQRRVDITSFRQEMRIGDSTAPIQIFMAASLGCGPCGNGFEKATRLISTYPGKASLTIRLRTGSSNNGRTMPGTWLLGYWQQHIFGQADTSHHTEQLLRDWFNTMNLEKFRQQYELEISDGVEEEISVLKESHAEWIEQAAIKRTPTFFINGYQLPSQYEIEDLMLMIPALIARLEKEQEEVADEQMSV